MPRTAGGVEATTPSGAARSPLAPGRLVALGLAVAVCASLPMLLLGALAVQIRADLGVGAAGVGAGVAAFFFAGSLGSAALGRVVERIGGRRGLQLASGLAATGLLGIAVLGRSLGPVLLFLAIGGFAVGAAHPAANLVLMRGVRERRRGLVFGIKQSAIPLASLLGGLAVPAIGLTVGWRWAFAGAGLLAVLLTLSIPSDIARIAPRRTPSRTGSVDRLGRARGPLLLVTVAAAFAALAANPLAAFLTITYVDAGLSEATAGWLLAVSSAVGVAARVLIGWLADRVAALRLGAVGALLLAGAGSFVLLATGQSTLVVAGSLLGYAIGWGWPGLLNYAVASARASAPAAATGILQTGIYIGAGVGPLGFGLVVDEASLTLAWTLAALSGVIGGVLMIVGHVWLRRRTAPSG